MKDDISLSSNYKRFCNSEGSQHIASEFAIEKLQELIKKFQVRNVLEIGLGIGSIAGCLLTINKNIVYKGTENNEFCLKALKQNLGTDYQRTGIYPRIADMESKSRFDLIIIDGMNFDLQEIRPIISPNGIIAIEGDRLDQQEGLQNIFNNHSFVHCISWHKNKNYSPFPSDHWQGGIKVIFINPSFLQRLWWIKEKLKTKFKYFYRNFYSK